MFQVAGSSVVVALLLAIKGALRKSTGMRNSSQILIFIHVQKALDAGIKFYLSANGVVLTGGDSNGLLSPEFFLRVENADRTPLNGWEGSDSICVPTDLNLTIGDVLVDGVKPSPLLDHMS